MIIYEEKDKELIIPASIGLSGGVSEEEVKEIATDVVNDALTDYATIDYVDEKVAEAVGVTPEVVDEKIETALDGYATKTWVAEQGYLTEHQTLKTINGESVVGEGNIEIQGGGESYNGNIILGGSSETEPYMREQNKKVWDMLEAGTYRGGFLVQVGTGGTYSVSVLTNWFKAMGKYTFTAEYFNGSTQQMFYNSVSLWEDNASLSAYNSLTVQKQITAGTNISIDNKNKINCTIDTTGFATKSDIPDVSGKVDNINGVEGIWQGTQAEYDALPYIQVGILYIVK